LVVSRWRGQSGTKGRRERVAIVALPHKFLGAEKQKREVSRKDAKIAKRKERKKEAVGRYIKRQDLGYKFRKRRGGAKS
jgi:hypothetical protein